MTGESTTSLHVVQGPLSTSDRTLTPPGGSIDVASRHEAPRRGIGLRLAIGAAILVSLGAALQVAIWVRTDTAAAPALDGAALAPDTTAAPSAAPTSPATTAAPARGGAPLGAPPARNNKNTILGI
jgi:hypothetical protein